MIKRERYKTISTHYLKYMLLSSYDEELYIWEMENRDTDIEVAPEALCELFYFGLF